MTQKKRLTQIKEGAMSRGLALAKLSVSAGAKAASHAFGNIFANETEKADRLKSMLLSQIDLLSRELGQLKGSLMKVGQMLSMYGEHFLPPEANALLKSLQSQSPPLEWKAIEKSLKRQLTPEKLALLDVDQEPLASASLGQVHRAVRKSDSLELALKVQYPGVDAAIEGDLKALKSILALSKLIPKGHRYDDLFKEVRMMLHQEVNYSRELELTDQFRELLKNDPRFIVPQTFPEFSTKKVLATSLEAGVPVDGPEVLSLSQDRRDAIGQAFIELYFREIFDWGFVQTDPHFGNYRLRTGNESGADRIVLLDFGAVRQLPEAFKEPYRMTIRGAFQRNYDLVVKGAKGLGFIRPDDSEELCRAFFEFVLLITEVFYTPGTPGVPVSLYDDKGRYLWGESDLPSRVAKKATQMATAFKFRPPPREVVFLDRKLAGIFIFLKVLKVRTYGPALTEKYL